MLILHKPILADDPDRILQFERGLFEVVSPQGETVRVACPPATKLKAQVPSNREHSTRQRWWRIEKLQDS